LASLKHVKRLIINYILFIDKVPNSIFSNLHFQPSIPYIKMKIFNLIIFAFMLTGCDNEKDMEIIINKNSIKVESFPESKEFKFTKLIDFNEGTPFKIYEADSGLYVFDVKGKNDKVFHFYSFKSKDFTASYIGKGSGPYETFSPKSSGIKNGVLWVMDFTMHKVIEYDLKNLDEKSRQKETKLVDYFNTIQVLNENEILANGLETSPFKFQKVDRNTGEVIDEFGVFEKVPENIPFATHNDFFQASFAIKPDGKQLVSAYRWNEAIEIFDLNTLESMLIWGPENINNEFALKKDEFGQMIFERRNGIQKCNIDVFATDDYIFSLFSGNYDSIMDSQFTDTINVYLWDGTPVKKIKVDRRIERFSVSPDNKTLYAFDVNSGEILYIKLDLTESK